jgi:hypothetical protein
MHANLPRWISLDYPHNDGKFAKRIDDKHPPTQIIQIIPPINLTHIKFRYDQNRICNKNGEYNHHNMFRR